MVDSRALVETFIRKATKRGSPLQPSRLLNRISDKTGLSIIAVEECLAALVQDGMIEGVSRNGIPVKMVHWKGSSLLETTAHGVKVRDHFINQHLEVSDSDCLAVAKAMGGLEDADVTRLLNGLSDVQDHPGDAVFASARHLLGSAKALKGLSTANRVLASLPTQNTGEMFVITAGPTNPEAVVLIENLRSFTAFADSSHTQTAMGVACYGYGLTMQNFATHLKAGKVTACPCRGDRPNLQHLIETRPVFLWGDLDQEGLRIYEGMRKLLPSLRLSAAYSAMEKLIDNPNRSHPYHRLFEKDGQRPAKGELAEVAHLSRVCRDRAVDQEALGADIDSIAIAEPYSW